MMVVLEVMEGCSSEEDDPNQISDLLMAADDRIQLIASHHRERSSEHKASASHEDLQMKAFRAERKVLLSSAGVRKSVGSSMELCCELQCGDQSSQSLQSAELINTPDQLSGIFSTTKHMFLTIHKRENEFILMWPENSVRKREITTG